MGTLFVCATPIGNLTDVSLRLLEVLKKVDLIAAEDTRRIQKLLNHFSIKSKTTSYHKFNAAQKKPMVLAVLLSGKSVALLSDSGTPAISDPGEELVNAAGLKGIKIVPIPGPCAAVAALSVSGMAAGQFCFEGFLPRQEKERRTRLGELAKEKRTLIFYEAPHRLLQTLQDLQLALGDREVFVAREMTKKFEELYRARLSRTLAHYRAQPPKGELVIVVAGVPEGALAENRENFTLDKLLTVLTRAGFSKKETAKIAAQCTGGSKNQIYKQLLEC